MKKIMLDKILGMILMASLLTGFTGIDIYKHICGSSGREIISVFQQKDCSSIEDENEASCCLENTHLKHKESGCCEKSGKSIQAYSPDCSNTVLSYKLDDPVLFTDEVVSSLFVTDYEFDENNTSDCIRIAYKISILTSHFDYKIPKDIIISSIYHTSCTKSNPDEDSIIPFIG